MWPGGAIVTALAVWAMRGIELAGSTLAIPLGLARQLPAIGVVGLVVSAIGAFSLVKPHDMIPLRRTARALLGASLYAVLIALFVHIHFVLDRAGGAGYFRGAGAPTQRTGERLVLLAVAALIALLLRPSARLLAGRCLVYRHGRADRQTIYAFIGALGLTAVGDLLVLALPMLPEPTRAMPLLIAWTIIAAGSLFVTVGLWSICIDAVRVARTILEPPPSLGAVVTAHSLDADRPRTSS